MKRIWLAISFLAAAVSVHGQPLERGDILVTADGPGPSIQSRILVYGNDGTYKWQLATSDSTFFRETLFHNAVVYVGTFDEIERSVLRASSCRDSARDAINDLSRLLMGGSSVRTIGGSVSLVSLQHRRFVSPDAAHPAVEDRHQGVDRSARSVLGRLRWESRPGTLVLGRLAEPGEARHTSRQASFCCTSVTRPRDTPGSQNALRMYSRGFTGLLLRRTS